MHTATMASGILTQPYVIRKIVRDSVEVAADKEGKRSPVEFSDDALSLIQEACVVSCEFHRYGPCT